MADYKEFDNDKFKAQALAVYDNASHGRDALDTISKSIDGVVDQLKKEIDKGDIEAAKITARRLRKSLPNNRAKMQEAFEKLPRE